MKTDGQQTVLQRFAYAYDAAGNRTTEQIDDAVTTSTYDALNRLTGQQGGGTLVVKGTVSEPAAVTINGQTAIVTSDLHFAGTTTVAVGTTPITITATDGSGNQATATYDVDQSAGGGTFTFDANGNLTADATRSFTWDAANRLRSVTIGMHTSTFTYDGLGRRVEIVEADNGTTTSDTTFVWCGLELCEARDATGGTVTKRYFAQGVQDAGVAYFYTRDHLGSIRELTDGTGTLHARYDYDPWGRRTKLAGDKDADLGYTGHYTQAPSGIVLAPFRAYDPNLARWFSEDPIGLLGGSNLYVFGQNSPVLWVDRLGLDVTNNTDHTIWAIGGDIHTLNPVAPGSTWKGQQDGLIDSVTHPGQVYKTTNGIDVALNENGSVNTTRAVGVFEWLYWELSRQGGWKDERWNENLNKSYDDSWNDAFNKSKEPAPYCATRGR